MKEYIMPDCPQCLGKLIKRKSINSYVCARHGLARKIMSPAASPYPDGMTDAEFDALKKKGVRAKKSVAKPKNNPALAHNFAGMADRFLKEEKS